MVNICIYIPTYNRPKSLYRQIKTITSQISNIDNIRIVVNDNNSSNNCNDYIKHEFKNIEYNKNIYNIGGNANILLGFLIAKMNEFLWILSDDDLLNIDSIKNIYDNIKEEYDFIYVSNVNEAKEINITDSDEYIKFAEIGRISCILYNMNVFCKYIETGFVHHNSSFPHLAIQMAAINDNKKINWAGPIATSQGLLVTGSNGAMDYYSPQDGKKAHGLTTGQQFSLSPIIVDKKIYTLNDSADVTAWN